MNIYSIHINILYEKQIKTVSSMRLEGTYWNWVSGFKLLYSDDAKYWTGYSSKKDLDKVTHILNFLVSIIYTVSTYALSLLFS